MKTKRLAILLWVGLSLTAGCRREAEKPAATADQEATSAAAKDYPISGRVVSIAPDKSAITLDVTVHTPGKIFREN